MTNISIGHLFFPTGLTIRKTVFAGVIHYGVFCTRTVISKGTKFGPFKGRIINTSEIKTNDDNSLMWEVSHFVFACFDSLRPGQHISSHVETGLPGLNQY